MAGAAPFFICMYLTRKVEHYDYSPTTPLILYKYNNTSNPYSGKYANIYYHEHAEYPTAIGINGEIFQKDGVDTVSEAYNNKNGGGFFGGFCKVKLQRPTSERKNSEIGYVGLYLPDYSGAGSNSSIGHTINLPTKKQIILGKIYDNISAEENDSYIFHFNYDVNICSWLYTISNSDAYNTDLFASGFKPFFYYTGQYGHGVSQSGCAIEKLELGLYVYELL